MGLGKIIPNTGLYQLGCLHAFNASSAETYKLKDSDGANVTAPSPFIWVALSTGTTTPDADDTEPDTEINNGVYARKEAKAKIIEQDTGNNYSVYVEYEATFDPGDIVDTGTLEVNGIALMDSDTTGNPYFIEVRNPILFDPTLGAIIRIRCTFARGIVKE
ncbi:hypothetical protein [Bacteroides sp.]|uniref:phage tail fiber protein n=1 Tax=Bacteroides sp. TaxID=29523 RepID=UPI00262AF2DD|nr:hypothetical protein [Bacteroides sp.]MDD3038998.1 hypothetical protein [Bacteroides sp.]